MNTYKLRLFLIAGLLFAAPQAFGTNEELSMIILNSYRQSASLNVGLYHYNDFTVALRYNFSTEGVDTFATNFACDIDDRPYYSNINDYTGHYYWRMIVPGEYWLQVSNKFVHILIREFINVDRDVALKFDGTDFSIYRGNRIVLYERATLNLNLISNVTVDQKLDDNDTTVGDLHHVFNDGSEITTENIPATIAMEYMSFQALRSDRNIINGQKYNNWSNLVDVTNHHRFEINSTNLSYTSHLKPTDVNATITTELIDLSSMKADSIEFADPWLVDYHDQQYGGAIRNQGSIAPLKTRGTPFLPNSSLQYSGDVYNGVFLNQDPEQNPNFYSVGAPAIQTVNNFAAYFLNWAGNGESVAYQNASALTTGVIFKQAGATAKALYKGHLISGSTLGFNTNGQRKLIRDGSGRLHVVYASGGSVWYSQSTDNGTTWSKELRINSPELQGKCPSIAYSNDGNDIISIGYQTDFDPISPAVVLNEYAQVGGTLQLLWSQVVEEIPSYSYDANPVVCAYSSVIQIIYKRASSEGLKGIVYTIDAGHTWGITSSSSYNVPNTNAGSAEPALSFMPTPSGSAYLAFQQGDTAIYYCDWAIGGVPTGSPANISSGSGCNLNRWPSVGVNAGPPLYTPKVIVSWTGSNQYTTMAVIRRKINSSWTSFYKASGYVGKTESSGVYGDSTYQAIVGWLYSYYSTQTQFIRLIGGSFGSIYNLPSVGQFHLSGGPSFSQMKAVLFNTNVSAPYPLLPLTYNFQTLMKEGSFQYHYGREAIVKAGGAEIIYSLSNVMLDGKGLTFLEEAENGHTNSVFDLNQILRTKFFPLNQESKLSFDASVRSIWPEKLGSSLSFKKTISYRTELVPVEENRAVSVLDSCTVSTGNLSDSIESSYTIDCSSITPGEYFLRVAVNAAENLSFSMADLQYGEELSLRKQQVKRLLPGEKVVVTAWSLDQNYPNPFNPSTIICYGVPQRSHVLLTVYNALGQQVAILVQGNQETGNHEVRFDASGLASGVYFYRMQAGAFGETKKLLLIR